MFLDTPKWSMLNECFSEAKEEKEEGSSPSCLSISYGPSAQLCDFLAEGGSQDHWLSQALFHDVLREVSVATEGGSGI